MEANKQNATPLPGFRRDGAGRLVPEALVKPADLQRDQLVRDLHQQFAVLREQCAAFRERAEREIDAHLDLIAEKYGLKRGGQAGNLVLTSYDGELRIMRATDKVIAFTDEIHAAKKLIFACVAEWSEGASPELRVVADEAFRVDKQGHLSVARILGLLRWDIKDERWLQAMQAIRDSVQVQSTRSYLRFYKRAADGAYAKLDSGI